jgi:hypothetical protein
MIFPLRHQPLITPDACNSRHSQKRCLLIYMHQNAQMTHRSSCPCSFITRKVTWPVHAVQKQTLCKSPNNVEEVVGYEKSSSPPGPWALPCCSPSMASTRSTSSLVSRAISKAMGGSDWFHCRQVRSPSSSSRASSAIPRPFSPDSMRRRRQVESLRRMGSA